MHLKSKRSYLVSVACVTVPQTDHVPRLLQSKPLAKQLARMTITQESGF